jgi:hypothetical protein
MALDKLNDGVSYGEQRTKINDNATIIEQNGILKWVSDVSYSEDAYIVGSDGGQYRALIGNIGNDPVSSPTQWKKLLFSSRGGGDSVFNTAIGEDALIANTSGIRNTAIGNEALKINTTGQSNTATGVNALRDNNGDRNTANGVHSLRENDSGIYNTAIGYETLMVNDNGDRNTASGYASMRGNLAGSNNTAAGNESLYQNTGGVKNTAIGNQSLRQNTTGSSNVAMGHEAGRYIAGGSVDNETSGDSVFLGSETKAKEAGGTNEIVIGHDATGNGDNTATYGNGSVTEHVFTGGRLIVADSANHTPATAGADGTTGEIAWDDSHIYVCTATNTWKRTAITTWV